MPVTFVRTTDRPRLFDDRPSPRARRPARRTDRDRTPSGPDAATPSFDFAAPSASPPAPPEPDARAPQSAPAEPDARAPQAAPAERFADADARAFQPARAERLADADARAFQPAPAPTPEVEPGGSPAVEHPTPGFDLAPADTDHAPHSHDPASSGAAREADTLDSLISGVWDELSAHRTVSCPVCHGQMVPRYGSAELPVGGRCRRCGSTLG